jgi:hypothetical protein
LTKTKKTEEALLKVAIAKSEMFSGSKQTKQPSFAELELAKEVWQRRVFDYINNFVSDYRGYFGGSITIHFGVNAFGKVRLSPQPDQLFQECSALILEAQPLPIPPECLCYNGFAPCELTLTFRALEQENPTISEDAIQQIRRVEQNA